MKNSWIKCTFGMPGVLSIDGNWHISQNVLVYNKKNLSIRVGYYQVSFGKPCWIVDDYESPCTDITHWQPLEYPHD